MRKWICILALLLCSSAFAEEYWTRGADWYYHAYEACQGAGDMVPLSQVAADEFEKFPCPVCVPEADGGEEIQAVARGGTIVLRFSDEWLAQQELTNAFGWDFAEPCEGEAAEAKLAKLFHGEDYVALKAQYESEGSAEALARYPDILEQDSRCQILNQRHIGSHWYITLRPEEAFGDSWEMYWRIDGDRVTMENGTLQTSFELQTLEAHLEVPVQRSASTPVFEMDTDALNLQVFDELGTHIAVIRQKQGDADFLEGQELRIGGADTGITLNGYMDAESAIFCCVLTEGELHALRSGATVEIPQEPVIVNQGYMRTPYAVATRGTGLTGIVNEAGEYVVEPIYKSISRPDPESFPNDQPPPFFCTGVDGSETILHGETLAQIAHFEEEHGYLRAEYVNPAMFVLYDDRGEAYYSLADGSLLFGNPLREDGSHALQYDGWYRLPSKGIPQRLAVGADVWPTQEMWLTDNHGKRVTEQSWQRITPLCWLEDRGVFLVEAWDEWPGGDYHAFENYYAYTGGPAVNWRCGLIDQDGNEILPLQYISVEYMQDGSLEFILPDGSHESYMP